MENADYTEWVPMGKLVNCLVAMVITLVIFITVTVMFFGGLSIDSFYKVALNWAVLVFIVFVFWNYRGLRIQIIGDRLLVVYGRFNKKSFSLKDISSCTRTRANFGRYLGIGVRYGFDGSIAYTTSFGDAVQVAPKLGRVFVFSSNNPDQVCEIIKRKAEHLWQIGK